MKNEKASKARGAVERFEQIFGIHTPLRNWRATYEAHFDTIVPVIDLVVFA